MSADQVNTRPPPDKILSDIADYVVGGTRFGSEAYNTARLCLMDALGCGILALGFADCTRHLGPIVPQASLKNGARVPGTAYQLDPVQAAFNIGCMIRWLDFNDTFLAAEWGHPSDNLGGILAAADYSCRSASAPLVMGDVLAATIQAYEIQGVLALQNSFNRVGLDHVMLVKVATTAVVTRLLGGTHRQIIDALSQAWVDGSPLRTYRQSPNTGPRKSWAAGDATARGVWLALLTLGGEGGMPSVLSAPRFGFCDVLFGGHPVELSRPLGSYVIENVLFKISAPAEFHAQTAMEAAAVLRPQVLDRLEDIRQIRVWTQEPALRIICKEGPLNNPADRDHCLQYIIAVSLLHDITAEDYGDEFHRSEGRIDALRRVMVVQEEPSYSRDYYDPDKRSIANAVQVIFKDGSATPRVEVQYPVGHRRRRTEAIPLLERKLENNLSGRFSPEQCQRIVSLCRDQGQLENMPVGRFMDLWAPPHPTHA